MAHTQIIIIGAGLSGLYAAYQLEQQGMTDYLVVEAREEIGGRIQSITIDAAQSESEAFDLGATWFWEKQQPQLTQLIDQFGLESFYQYEQGDLLIDRTSSRAALRMQGVQTAPARRLKGGMKMLVQKIATHIPNEKILLGHSVKTLRQQNEVVEVEITTKNAQITTLTTSQILLAVPPRLAINNIQFLPALPQELTAQWQNTNTWMAAHAKYFAIYPHAFWREQNLSGAVHGTVTPLFEIHDASSLDGNAALFGFIGAPVSSRQQLSEAALCQLCRKQLVRLFGEQAAHPIHEFIKDWTTDPWVATPEDATTSLLSAGIPDAMPSNGNWKQHLIAISTEFSPHYQGYLAGAIEAASLGVETVIKHFIQQKLNHA